MLCAPCPFTPQFLFYEIQLLHSDPSSHMNHLHQQQPQQTPTTTTTHLFSIPCIYSFCAPYSCNVRNASACWLCTIILHLSSALSDHHRDSSASLVVFPVCPASLYVILRFLSLFGSLRLFVFSVTVELTFSVSVIGLNAHQLSIASMNIFIPLKDSSPPLSVIPKCLHILW
jgi:hypothetical protein